MPEPKPKLKKVGRPVLPKGHAKTRALQVRLNTEDRKRVEQAAKASEQTVSEWIRSILNSALEA